MNLASVNSSQEKVKYRLGDAVLLKNSARGLMKHFPDTIGYDYLSAINWSLKPFNKDTFLNVVNNHIDKHNYKAPETEFVLHWRLYPRTSWKMNMEKLKEIVDGRDITVCAAIHSGCERGINDLYKYLENDNVRLQSSTNPDEDFAFAFQAENLICTVGTFSGLLYKCREHNTWHMWNSKNKW